MQNRVRKSSALRKEEIARAVLQIIGEHGLKALTMSSIAKEIGLTSGALFRHFASREDMLRAAVDWALERVESTFPDPSAAPLERLLSLGHARVEMLGSDRGLAWLLRSEQALLLLPEDSVAKLRRLVQRSKGTLLEALREAAAEGSIRRDIPPEHLLVVFMGTVHTLIGMRGMHRPASSESPQDPEQVLSSLMIMLAPSTGGTHHER